MLKGTLPIFVIYFFAPLVIRFDEISQPIGWLIDISLRLFIPSFCLILLAHRWRVYPTDYGLALNATDLRRIELIGASVICFIAYLSYIPVENILRWSFGVEPGAMAGAYPISPDGPIGVLALIYDLAVPPFFEEVLYRGILAAIIVGNTGDFRKIFIYVLVSAMLFGHLHSSSISMMIATTYLGAVSCLLYLWIRNLWPLIFAHFSTNLLIFGWTVST